MSRGPFVEQYRRTCIRSVANGIPRAFARIPLPLLFFSFLPPLPLLTEGREGKGSTALLLSLLQHHCLAPAPSWREGQRTNEHTNTNRKKRTNKTKCDLFFLSLSLCFPPFSLLDPAIHPLFSFHSFIHSFIHTLPSLQPYLSTPTQLKLIHVTYTVHSNVHRYSYNQALFPFSNLLSLAYPPPLYTQAP